MWIDFTNTQECHGLSLTVFFHRAVQRNRNFGPNNVTSERKRYGGPAHWPIGLDACVTTSAEHVDVATLATTTDEGERDVRELENEHSTPRPDRRTEQKTREAAVVFPASSVAEPVHQSGMDGKNFGNGQQAQQDNRDALTDSVPSQDLETLKLFSDSDAGKNSPANGDESADVNMEAAISTEDVVRAGGFGAKDDIGSLLPTAIDFTDFEASLRDACDFEGEKEKPSHPGLGWKGKEADDGSKPSDAPQ